METILLHRTIFLSKNIILKLGSEGALLHFKDKLSVKTDRIHALNDFARDVAGAGDSMLISSAMALAKGANPWESAFIGSLAAAVQVGRVGNIPLKTEDLVFN